jgi:hypothetical protein
VFIDRLRVNADGQKEWLTHVTVTVTKHNQLCRNSQNKTNWFIPSKLLFVTLRMRLKSQTPYASTPYGSTPYASTPYGSTPYASTPYASTPYASTPYASTPYASTPYASTPYASTPCTLIASGRC